VFGGLTVRRERDLERRITERSLESGDRNLSHPTRTVQAHEHTSPRGRRISVIIDCDACVMQDTHACNDCIVPVLLDLAPDPVVQLDDAERTAIDHLSDAGLVAPLRLVPRLDRPGDAAVG
jgi:hypothetical protein